MASAWCAAAAPAPGFRARAGHPRGVYGDPATSGRVLGASGTPPRAPTSSQPARPATTKPTALSTPWVLAMASMLNAGIDTYWASAHCTASTMGMIGENAETTSRARPALRKRSSRRAETDRGASAGGDSADVDVASSMVPNATAHAATVIPSAPPTWPTPEWNTKPVATTGGLAMAAMHPVTSDTALASQSTDASPAAASTGRPNPA